jgi:hypothetical protein
MKPLLTFVLPLALVAACASPKPPTMTEADLEDAGARHDVLEALPVAVLPATGSQTMSGHLGGAIMGDVDGYMLGDMTLTSDFGTDSVSGSVTNINVFDEDGIPDQLLDGSLGVTGGISGSGMTATASGTVSGVDHGFSGDSNVNLSLDGTYRQNGAVIILTGDVTGGGTGDFDVTLVDGQFYVE